MADVWRVRRTGDQCYLRHTSSSLSMHRASLGSKFAWLVDVMETRQVRDEMPRCMTDAWHSTVIAKEQPSLAHGLPNQRAIRRIRALRCMLIASYDM